GPPPITAIRGLGECAGGGMLDSVLEMCGVYREMRLATGARAKSCNNGALGVKILSPLVRRLVARSAVVPAGVTGFTFEESLMSQLLDNLVSLLALEKIEENLFRGRSEDLGFRQLFGGQVLGQALSAASQTVDPA